MATYDRGAIGTSEINSARIVKDMSEDILLLEPKNTPFLVFSKKMRKQPAHNMKFYWQEDEIIGYRSAVASGEAITLTAGSESNVIEVTDAEIFNVGNMLLIEDSGVVAYVSDAEDSKADHIKIIPGFDDADTAVDIAGDEVIQIIGTADAEGNGVMDENRRQIGEKYNFLQQFKTNFSMTDIQMNTNTYNEQEEWGYLRAKKGKQHNRGIERALMFGGRSKRTNATIGDHPIWTTRGIFNSISTNVQTLGSSTALTEDSWNEFLKDYGFDHGSNKKTLFASKTLAHQISTFAQDNVRIKDGKNKKFGINVDTYISSLGYELDVVVHPYLEGGTYGQAGVVLDMDAINLRYLKGSEDSFDTKLLVDVIKDGVHKQTDEYFSVLGLELRQEKKHAVIKNTLDNS